MRLNRHNSTCLPLLAEKYTTALTSVSHVAANAKAHAGHGGRRGTRASDMFM
jgi:hypothetical protein